MSLSDTACVVSSSFLPWKEVAWHPPGSAFYLPLTLFHIDNIVVFTLHSAHVKAHLLWLNPPSQESFCVFQDAVIIKSCYIQTVKRKCIIRVLIVYMYLMIFSPPTSCTVVYTKWAIWGETRDPCWFILERDAVVVLQFGAAAALIKCFDAPNKSSVFYCD